MKTLITLALLLIGYSGHAFIHTYIHLAPNFNSCQTELDFAICNETPYTYIMTYNGNPISSLDFPMNGGPACTNGTGMLYFSATNGTENYEFEVQINYSPTGITIQYIQEPAVRPLSIIQHHQPSGIVCSGEISLTVDGGYPPYQTQWLQNGNPYPASPGDLAINQLCPGQYGYSISDDYSHCGINPPIIRSVTIDFFDCMIATTPMSCPEVCDGTAELILMGSNAVSATSILHFDGQNDALSLNNLCAGMTTGFAVHLSGAYATCMPGTVTEPIEPVYDLELTHVTGFGLTNGSAEVTVTSGTGPFTYQWQGENLNESGSSSIEGLAAGTYSLTIGYNEGCELHVDFDISEPAQLQITPIDVQDQTTAAPNGLISFEITGGVEPYVLFVNDVETTYSGMLSELSAGIYQLKVFDDNMNEAEVSVEIRNTLNILSNVIEFSVYPNPATSQSIISTSEPIQLIRILSPNGQVLDQYRHVDTTTFELNLSSYAEGVYFINLDFHSGVSQTIKLIKQ